jgi:multicomponent Na+:H+ antiporter subunit D
VIQHLPILQVILPLLAAPICLILGKPRLVWIFALLVSIATLLVSILLWQQVNANGVISYNLGGWQAPSCSS